MKNLQHPTFDIQRPITARAGHRSVLQVKHWALNAPKFVLILAIRAYRLTISPAQTFLFGATGGCRFTPTCSVYALDALREHGAVKGTALVAGRICRCHPWGGCGHDPVPKAETGKRKAGNILGHAHS